MSMVLRRRCEGVGVAFRWLAILGVGCVSFAACDGDRADRETIARLIATPPQAEALPYGLSVWGARRFMARDDDVSAVGYAFATADGPTTAYGMVIAVYGDESAAERAFAHPPEGKGIVQLTARIIVADEVQPPVSDLGPIRCFEADLPVAHELDNAIGRECDVRSGRVIVAVSTGVPAGQDLAPVQDQVPLLAAGVAHAAAIVPTE
jgi:hypothetical protein